MAAIGSRQEQRAFIPIYATPAIVESMDGRDSP
jgi:hypothetical protein